MDTYNIRECSLLLCFALILTVKLTVFLIRHTEKALSCPHMPSQETSKSVYIHDGSYINNFSFSSFDFPHHLCYNFPCIRGCLESLWREVQDIL